MMPTIEVDNPTYDAIDLAARLTSMTHGDVIARLVRQSQLVAQLPSGDSPSDAVGIYVDYDGHRTHGTYNRVTARIDITDGPLAGQHFKSPSSAARAVVAHYRPMVSPHRNGWSFWMLDDGTNRYLQSIRHDG